MIKEIIKLKIEKPINILNHIKIINYFRLGFIYNIKLY